MQRDLTSCSTGDVTILSASRRRLGECVQPVCGRSTSENYARGRYLLVTTHKPASGWLSDHSGLICARPTVYNSRTPSPNLRYHTLALRSKFRGGTPSVSSAGAWRKSSMRHVLLRKVHMLRGSSVRYNESGSIMPPCPMSGTRYGFFELTSIRIITHERICRWTTTRQLHTMLIRRTVVT